MFFPVGRGPQAPPSYLLPRRCGTHPPYLILHTGGAGTHSPCLLIQYFAHLVFSFQKQYKLRYSTEMGPFWQNLFVFLRSAPAQLKFAFSGQWRTDETGRPAGEHEVSPDFFGICAAGSGDPAGEDYIVEKLKDLGLKSVRVDFSYHSRGQYGEKFLRRLIAEKFNICLHLVQPFAEAAQMPSSGEAMEKWRVFAAETLTAYGPDIKLVEIGSTVNRRKWAGYSIPGFIAAWKIAREVAAARNCRLAGPNVTDFEPFFNIALLNEMKRNGLLPDVHTDNLFAERATEPESFDQKIAGRRLAGFLRFNLVRKALVLREIALAFGVSPTSCPHVSWSLRRIARLHEKTEEKQADYLARYCCLAAASGALEQVYWGPLIGQREGLIDDGTAEFPEIPHVTFYGQARGQVKNYRIRPAFYAMQAARRFLAGTVYVRHISHGCGLEIHEFSSPAGRRHVAWTMNGRRALVRECYPAKALEKAVFFSRGGAKLGFPPAMISESPVYIEWPEVSEVSAGQTAASASATPAGRGHPAQPGDSLCGINFAEGGGSDYDFVACGELAGICLAGCKESVLNAIASPGTNLLRDARNRVWLVAPPGRGSKVVVKLFRPPGRIRRFLRRKKGDKALRSWNGAQELLRRGIATPLPVAFLHNPAGMLACESWYICDEFAGGFSARDAFTAFSRGAQEFEGLAQDDFYSKTAIFLRKMHDRGVYFRDLSAGNLLFQAGKKSELEFALIDTARAVFREAGIGLRERLCDLMRLCHPLEWKGRKELIGKYMALSGWRYRPWMDIPFHYYDFKHWLKRKFKRLRRSFPSKTSVQPARPC